MLHDILWHIDGHHVFQQRAQPIPSSFHFFINYNNPQLSTHRKRLTSNMSSDALRDFALELSSFFLLGQATLVGIETNLLVTSSKYFKLCRVPDYKKQES